MLDMITISKIKQFVEGHRDKFRSLQRSTDFVVFSGNSLVLSGWSTNAVCSLIASGSKKPIELIVLNAGQTVRHEVGEIVSRNNVFVSSAGAVLDDDKIAFQTDEGLFVNIDQYIYMQQNGGLNGNQFFAMPEKKDSDTVTSWKYLMRRASQTRKDRSINILYLSFSAIQWEMEDASTKSKRNKVISPLFLCSIREDSNSKSRPRFSLLGNRLQCNSTLARMIKTQHFVDIYAGIPTEFNFAEFETYITKVKENIAELSNELKLIENDMHVCLLDSSNEMMCQAVERNIDRIVENPLVAVFAEAMPYMPKFRGQNFAAVYPLPADDSQREVVQRVLAGESINCHAGPGTGKSQTVVNTVCNMLIRGKTVCIMSEKAAANEVVVDYFTRCGLRQYCVRIDEKTTVKGIISQIKQSLAAADVYVDTEAAHAVVAAHVEVCNEFKKLNAIYDTIAELGTSVYVLIGEAISADDLEASDYIDAEPKDYQKLRRKINEFQTQLVDTMRDADWEAYISSGTTGDEEMDEILDGSVAEIENCKVKFKQLIIDKNIPKGEIATLIGAQIARFFAEGYIQLLDLKTYGNRKLKMLYKKLLESSVAMQSLSTAFVRQELGRRVKEAARNSKFVELLDRLSNARISLQDFFNTYGSEILKLCPILVGTPNALVTHDKLNNFDVLIVDESSQLAFTSTLPFLIGNRQLVVFGDPLQLDITTFWAKAGIYEQQDGEEFNLAETDKSILHVVQGKLPGCQLQYHYRSKTEELITVSNECCYDGLLNVAPDYYFGRENLPEHLGCELIEISDPELTPRGANLSEAQVIVDKTIEIRQNYPEKSVGIITFNDGQHTAINDEIDRRIDEDGSLSEILYLDGDKLFLRTLENAQGKEADVILISIGHYRRNKDGSISKQISILNSAGAVNRLNVLFTRARERIAVAISFSYKELRDTQDKEGIYRLYEYLHYIATGECVGHGANDYSASDKYNKVLVSNVAMITNEHQVLGKVGTANMTVDVGLVKQGEGHYDLGLLMPNKALTPNTICTKVSVLERAGWNVLPLSPVTCFTKPETFSAQLSKDIGEKVRYSITCTQSYVTDFRPDILFSIDDFKTEPMLESRITVDELVDSNFESAYAGVWKSEIKSADDRQLIKLVKAGNSQAKLKLYVMKLTQFAVEDRLGDLLLKVEELYDTEQLCCYLYAQLLRHRGRCEDEVLINKLLTEARNLDIKIGIGGNRK